MSKPTILLLITKADIGGAQIHLIDLMRYLSNQYTFILAVGEEDYLSEQARKLGVEVHILMHLVRPISLIEDWRAYRECIVLLRDIQPDLIHTHSSKAGVIGRLAAWKMGVSSLFTAHGWAFTSGAPIKQRLYGLVIESIICRLPGRVIAVSGADYELAKKYFVGADAKRYLVKNGVRQAKLEKAKEPTKELKIVSVGRLASSKNHSMLIDVLAQVDFPYQAKIIGNGPLHGLLQKKIAKMGLHKKIQLLGEQREFEAHLRDADLFILSSNYEGLPLSILEAMSYGLPVVACDVGGVSEAVIDGKTGLLSARHDTNAMVQNIRKMARDPNLRKTYGDRGLAHYQQKFTVQRMIKEINDVYETALEAT